MRFCNVQAVAHAALVFKHKYEGDFGRNKEHLVIFPSGKARIYRPTTCSVCSRGWVKDVEMTQIIFDGDGLDVVVDGEPFCFLGEITVLEEQLLDEFLEMIGVPIMYRWHEREEYGRGLLKRRE